jgi:hypothetical protein
MTRSSVALSILGSLGAVVLFCIRIIESYSRMDCWIWGADCTKVAGTVIAVVLGLLGGFLAGYRMRGAPLVLLAAAGVGFFEGDVRYVIVTVVFLLAALVAWTSLDENAVATTRADE